MYFIGFTRRTRSGWVRQLDLQSSNAVPDPTLSGQVKPIGEQVDDAKANVVAGEPGSARQGIAEAGNDFHRPDGSVPLFSRPVGRPIATSR